MTILKILSTAVIIVKLVWHTVDTKWQCN